MVSVFILLPRPLRLGASDRGARADAHPPKASGCFGRGLQVREQHLRRAEVDLIQLAGPQARVGLEVMGELGQHLGRRIWVVGASSSDCDRFTP